MDKLTYYYKINKQRLQNLADTNQDYYLLWFNINESAYKLRSIEILLNLNDLINFV